MATEEVCPICGRALHPGQEPAGDTGPRVPTTDAPTIEMVLPDTLSYADAPRASSVSLASARPGSVVDAVTVANTALSGSSGSNDPVPVAFAPAPATIPSALVDPHSVLNPDSSPMPAIDSSDDGLPPIDEFVDEPRRPQAQSQSDEYEELSGPPSWLFILLASYASALTLFCAWMFWTGRVRLGAPSPAAETIPADSRPDLGAAARGEPSRKLAALPPLAEHQITTLEHSLHIGQVEVTPIRVHAGRVILRHLTRDDARSQREGGDDALFLHVRLRNTSQDATFAPLDESLVREHDRGLPDSLIETGDHERIDIYPLAEHSEWGIAGQSFRELPPGEALETDLVSAPGALEESSDPMTWRIRLRTEPGKTETIAVRFAVREISRDGG